MIPRRIIPCIVLAALTAAAPAATDAERLHELFEQYDQWERREFPESAVRRGDYRRAHHITENSLAAIERRHEQRQAFMEQFEAIDQSQLGEVDLVSAEIFALRLQRDIDGHRHRTFLAPIGSRSGPHQSVPQMGDHARFESARDYENYLSRLERVPASINHTIERMRLGLEERRVPPRVVLEGVPAQFTSLLELGGLNRLARPFDDMPDTIDEETKDDLRNRFYDDAFPPIRDAMTRLGAFVTEEYIAGCRESIAANDWPDGAAYYEHQLWAMTTTRLTAQEIHEIGLAEVARIRAEMMKVIRSSDFMERYYDAETLDDENLFSSFIQYLRTDARFYHSSAEDLLDGYRSICKQVDAFMPKYFGILPREPYGVQAIPEFMAPRQTTAYYRSGNLKNNEPGWFYANTYALQQRPKYEMIPLALHEAVPGHHHQTAIARELEGIPEFRKTTWFTAFGEGWALYTERLGIEMGMYEDPYDDFGRLLYEMWRACRLVVDPGMHALGWSRQQAIDFMLQNTALSELNIVNEVDRYIAWPGQATAYKIGELKIRELRKEAEEKLGERFDLRGFHDVILGAGSVPLDVMERRVRDWMQREELAGVSYD